MRSTFIVTINKIFKTKKRCIYRWLSLPWAVTKTAIGCSAEAGPESFVINVFLCWGFPTISKLLKKMFKNDIRASQRTTRASYLSCFVCSCLHRHTQRVWAYFPFALEYSLLFCLYLHTTHFLLHHQST